MYIDFYGRVLCTAIDFPEDVRRIQPLISTGGSPHAQLLVYRGNSH